MEKKQIVFFQTDLSPSDEELFRLLVNNLKNYAVIILDPDGYIISWNKGAELIKGYNKDEVFHNHFSFLYNDEEVKNQKPNSDLRQAIINGSHEEETIWIRKNGSKFVANISLTVLLNPKGEIRGFTMIIKDIIKSKSSNQLLHSNELAKSFVHEKTSDLIKIGKRLDEEINRRVKYVNIQIPGNEKIEPPLKEKEVLIKEIHHRVKNNLQIISSLLNLQSAYIKDEASIEVFKESQNRVRSMALIHEKLYQSKDMSQIDFAGYVSELVINLFSSYNLNSSIISLHQDINDIMLGIDLAINLGLIINELVSNAFKHAFPDGRKGNLYISMNRDGNKYELIVEDDGIGFPGYIDFRNTESLGLQLIVSLVEQIGGEISLVPNHKTRFGIKFNN